MQRKMPSATESSFLFSHMESLPESLPPDVQCHHCHTSRSPVPVCVSGIGAWLSGVILLFQMALVEVTACHIQLTNAQVCLLHLGVML